MFHILLYFFIICLSWTKIFIHLLFLSKYWTYALIWRSIMYNGIMPILRSSYLIKYLNAPLFSKESFLDSTILLTSTLLIVIGFMSAWKNVCTINFFVKIQSFGFHFLYYVKQSQNFSMLVFSLTVISLIFFQSIFLSSRHIMISISFIFSFFLFQIILCIYFLPFLLILHYYHDNIICLCLVFCLCFFL